MKNTTKVRLHLSKNLFESLAQQVLAESKKNYGAGMEEVKAPKEKNEKAPKAEKKVEEAEVEEVSAQPGITKAPGLNLSKNPTQNIVYSKQDLKVKLMDLARQLNVMKGLDNAETSAIGKLIDDIITKLKDGTIANQINIADKAFKNATKNVKPSKPVAGKGLEEMETAVAEEGEVKEGIDPSIMNSFIESLAILAGVGGGLWAAVTKGMPAIAKKAMEENPDKFKGLDPNNPADVKKVADEMGSGAKSHMQKTAGGSGEGGLLGK